MSAFRYRIHFQSPFLPTHRKSFMLERRIIFHLLLYSGPPSTRRQLHHCPLVVGFS